MHFDDDLSHAAFSFLGLDLVQWNGFILAIQFDDDVLPHCFGQRLSDGNQLFGVFLPIFVQSTIQGRGEMVEFWAEDGIVSLA